MARPLLTRLAVFAAKAEATSGTAETLTAAEGKFNVSNVQINEETEFIQRPGQSVFSPITGVIGPRVGRATFDMELHGNGASGSPAWASVLLPACGFSASSNTYTVDSDASSPTTLTIGHFEDGRLRRIAGAAGSFTWEFQSGRPISGSFNFLGAYVAPSTLAKIAPDYPSTVPPRFVSGTITIGGTSYTISRLTLNVENEVVIRPDATAASGILGAVIVNRRVTVSIDPEALAYTTKDWNTDWVAGTEAALAVTVGTEANNTIDIDCPKLQLSEPPNPGDREGIRIDQLTFQANRSADAGDDELVVTLS